MPNSSQTFQHRIHVRPPRLRQRDAESSLFAMADIPIQIRRAEMKDLPILAKFGLALAQLHATFDERRFVVPEDGEVSFMRFFEAELAREDAVLLVAEIAATPVGYTFVRIEAASLEDLRGMGAWLHDIYVAPDGRAL